MQEELKQIFRASRRTVSRRWACAHESQLAAYVDGGLESKARARLEAHLADCEPCLGQVSFLVRSSEYANAVEVPQQLLTKAKKLVAARPNRTWPFDWRWATATVAACLVLAALALIGIRLGTSGDSQRDRGNLIVQQSSPKAPLAAQPSVNPRNPDAIASSNTPAVAKPGAPKPESSVAVVRGVEAPNGSPKLLAPRDAAVVKRDSLTFRWQAVSDAEFYEVSVMTASGDVVISRQVEGESMNVPREMELQTGTKYFVSISAHLHNGKTMRSNIASFRIQ